MSVAKTNPTPVTVRIRVVPDPARPPAAHLIFEPEVLWCHPEDRIQWMCDDGPFVIEFLRSTPLGKMHFHSSENRTVPIAVPRRAARGRYHYAVAVCSEGIVQIDAGCPEIIIED